MREQPNFKGKLSKWKLRLDKIHGGFIEEERWVKSIDIVSWLWTALIPNIHKQKLEKIIVSDSMKNYIHNSVCVRCV